MRKLFSSGLVFFAGVVSPIAVSPTQCPKTDTPDYRRDPRSAAVSRFFEKGDCPAKAWSHIFVEAADHYHLDWRLLPSISYIESTGGKAARNNNLFGWDSGRAHFSSPSAGIHAVGYSLSHASQYRRKNLDQVLATYNPNADYAQRVKSVMRQIATVQ
jgi:hypothetical protein